MVNVRVGLGPTIFVIPASVKPIGHDIIFPCLRLLRKGEILVAISGLGPKSFVAARAFPPSRYSSGLHSVDHINKRGPMFILHPVLRQPAFNVEWLIAWHVHRFIGEVE